MLQEVFIFIDELLVFFMLRKRCLWNLSELLFFLLSIPLRFDSILLLHCFFLVHNCAMSHNYAMCFVLLTRCLNSLSLTIESDNKHLKTLDISVEASCCRDMNIYVRPAIVRKSDEKIPNSFRIEILVFRFVFKLCSKLFLNESLYNCVTSTTNVHQKRFSCLQCTKNFD